MEATQAVQRRLMLSLARSLHCQCSISSAPRAIKHSAPRHTRRQLPPSSRAFSTSPIWRQEDDSLLQQANEASSSPPAETPKQALKAYISAIQTIIDGYTLKDNMSPRQHEQLVVALTNAETRLNAPGQLPASFEPLLQQLKGEVNPILERRFGTTDVQSLRTKATAQLSNTTSRPSSQATSAAEEPRRSINENLTFAFGKPKAPPPKQPAIERPVPRMQQKGEPIDETMFQNLTTTYNNMIAKDARGTVSDIFRDSAQRPSESLSRADRNRMSLDSQYNESKFAQGHQNFMESNKADPTREVLRLKPTLGRSIKIQYGGDLTRAFRALEGLCARNGVRRDQIKQRFHVRRGQMKKDLRISRWRKQFMEGFLAECARVRRMRRQGW